MQSGFELVKKLYCQCKKEFVEVLLSKLCIDVSPPVSPAEVQVLGVQTIQRLCGVPRDAAAEVPVSYGASPAPKEDVGR